MLALTAALVAPYFIDWSSYRSAFEREAGRVLGREVQVEGTARARLLPFPSVTFTDVVVEGDSPGDTAMTVDEFSMDAELAPFLRGEVLIFDMRLVRPNMTIDIGPEGGVDWAARPSSRFDPRQVTLEKVSVTDGTITVHQQASGRTVNLDNINSELSARSLAGPWRINGSLNIDGIPATLSAATGRADDDGRMRLRMTVEPHDYPISLSTDGHAQLVQGEGLYSGTFRLNTVEETGEGEGQATAQADNPGNRLTGRFSLDHLQLAVEEFLFETGPEEDPYTAQGQAVVSLGAEPSFSVTADGAQIMIESSDASGEGVPGLSADERLAALTDFMANLPKPSIPGIVAVNLPAIVAGDTTIRNIRVEAEPVAEGWNIHSAAATLPGRTRFEGAGLLATGEELSFDGNMILAIGQPSGFAAWLARDVDDAIRRLPSAGFSADVSLTSERQNFENLELILGDARFRGSIDRQTPANARPSLMLTLEGDRLDVEGMQAFASLFIDDTGRNRLADHDVDLEISAGPVSARGVHVERLESALRLREGGLEIDRLAITGLAGARISATGQIRDIGGQPTGRVDATVIAVDLAPLVELLAQRFPDVDLLAAIDRNAADFPGLLSDGEVNFVATAADDGDDSSSLAVSADGRAGGTNFSISFSGSGNLVDAANAHSTINFSAQNDDASVLYALFGLPALPLNLAGPAEVDISATGAPAEGMDTNFHFSGEGISAGFEGEVAFAGEGPRAKGTAKIESEDLEPWLAVAGVSFPGFGFGLPAELSANVEYSAQVAVMNDIAGHFAGGRVSGDLNGELRDGIPHITGELALDTLDLGIGAEMIAGSTSLQNEGGTWPQEPFQQSVSLPFSADVAMTAEQLWIGNAGDANEARMRLTLEPGRFAVSELSAQHFGGTVEGSAELQNTDGTGLLSAQISLRDTELSQLLPGDGISGRADLGASLTANGRSVDAMVSSLAGSGSASLETLTISGIDNTALEPILERADALGVDIDAENVAAFAPEIVRAGEFQSEPVQLAFSIANGVARTPPVQLENENASMSVEAVADFRDRTVSASGTVIYDPGVSGIAGSDPVLHFATSGTFNEAQLRLDTEPLAQFLTQRALEREQERVEHMQAVLLEAQRLRREVRYFEAREAQRRAAEAERVRLERQAEIQRKAMAERERERLETEEDARQRAERVLPDGQGSETAENPPSTSPNPSETESAIEREQLPQAPSTGSPAEQGDIDIDIENLTVKQLIELLEPQD